MHDFHLGSWVQGLADGTVNVVIGTHAIASARFHKLAMVVIDEEQRFGEAHKRALRSKGGDAHSLVITATPLPRTLQGALVGTVGVSLLAQPPASRLPIRSVAVPSDPVVVRAALMRESRRGGQSFVICPMIEDLGPMLARLSDVVPELSIVMAHGRMRGEELDRVVLAFAEGEGDVLLTTNIVETGLDIPNANTMLIWRADRFGLAQLHQLRGRIGRGRVRASAYMLTDTEHPPSARAQKRLDAAGALQHLGAGFDISIADLEQRGAGDLLGEDQAGHIRLIGTELYRHVLSQALARAGGEHVEEDRTPDLVVNAEANLPPAFVPEPDIRLEIYRRLSRIETAQGLEEMAEELADRFGDVPEPAVTLIEVVRLRLLCQKAHVSKVLVGPQGVAITWHNGDRTVIDTGGEPARAGLQRALAAIQREHS